MSALDLSLAAKMMQKVHIRKRRKCANDIATFLHNRLFTFADFAFFGSLEPMQADRAEAGDLDFQNGTSKSTIAHKAALWSTIASSSQTNTECHRRPPSAPFIFDLLGL